MTLPRNAAGQIDLDAISKQQGLTAPSAQFMDIPKALGAGAGEGTQAIGEGIDQRGKQLAHTAVSHPDKTGLGGLAVSAGMEKLGELLDDAGHGLGDFFINSMSEGGQAVNNEPITDAVKNPLNWPQVGARIAGQIVPVIAGSAATGPVGATALGFAQGEGMTHAGAKSSAQIQISQMQDDQLLQSPTFVNLFKNIDQSPQYKNLSDLEKIDLAKSQLADTVAMGALNNPAVLAANIVTAYSGDAELGRLVTGDLMKGMEKSLLGSLVKHGSKNAGLNATQAGIQQWAINEELNNAGLGHRDAMQGVKHSAGQGAATGALMAIAPAVIGSMRNRVGHAGEKPLNKPENDDKSKQTEEAVDDIENGVHEAEQGVQNLKEEVSPEADLFGKGLSDSTEPNAEHRSGHTASQIAEQKRLAKGFEDRDKYGGNRPDEFADVPAYMRAGKSIHADPDPRLFHLVDTARPEGQVKARFDNPHDADIFEAADNMNLYARGKHPKPDEAEHQALKDWFYRMTRGINREDAKPKNRRKKGSAESDKPRKQPRNDFEAKNIYDTIMGYHQFVKDAARSAENGEYTAPSMEDYANHRFPDRPLSLEDKNIIFADGPTRSARTPLTDDEHQASGGPEFRGG